MEIGRFQLGSILRRHGAITEAGLCRAMRHHQQTGCRLGEALLALELCTEAQLARALAEQVHMPFVDLAAAPVPARVLRELPGRVARELGVVPASSHGGQLVVAARDPFNFHLDRMLREHARNPATIACGVPSQIAWTLEHYEKLCVPHPNTAGWDAVSELWEQLPVASAPGSPAPSPNGYARAATASSAPAEPADIPALNALVASLLREGAEIEFDIAEDRLLVEATVGGTPRRLSVPRNGRLRLRLGPRPTGAEVACTFSEEPRPHAPR
jgi:hypothetical protein